MQYPIFIHKDPGSDYGVTVPDLPGCFSAGKDIQDAMKNAREAIECHLEGLLEDNDAIPLRKPIEQHLENPDYRDGVLALVEVDLSSLGGLTTRINVSMPGRFLRQIDEYTSCAWGKSVRIFVGCSDEFYGCASSQNPKENTSSCSDGSSNF